MIITLHQKLGGYLFKVVSPRSLVFLFSFGMKSAKTLLWLSDRIQGQTKIEILINKGFPAHFIHKVDLRYKSEYNKLFSPGTTGPFILDDVLVNYKPN